MERDEDLEDGEMEDRERKDGGGVANIYDEQSSAGGAAEISAAHPIPSFIPPPLNPYNRLLAEVLMERDEDLEDGEMEDREREDGGGWQTFTMNRAAPEALLKFLLLTPSLPSFLSTVVCSMPGWKYSVLDHYLFLLCGC